MRSVILVQDEPVQKPPVRIYLLCHLCYIFSLSQSGCIVIRHDYFKATWEAWPQISLKSKNYIIIY